MPKQSIVGPRTPRAECCFEGKFRSESVELSFAEVLYNLHESRDSSCEEAGETKQDYKNVLDESPAEATERLVGGEPAEEDVDDGRKHERKRTSGERSNQRDHELELRNNRSKKNCNDRTGID